MATTPNKKSTIRELMYLEQEKKYKKMMEEFEKYGESPKEAEPSQGTILDLRRIPLDD